jgi:glycosyltransferase involved in cell wall biosynthesis
LSHDGTLEVAKRISPDVIAIRELRRGKGAAMRAGFAAARGDYIVVLDADGSMDPKEIGGYVDALDADFELVKGSRYLSGSGSADLTWLRSFGNSALRDLANVIFGTRFSELCCGYFAFRRNCLGWLALDAVGFEIETQVVTHAIRAGSASPRFPVSNFLVVTVNQTCIRSAMACGSFVSCSEQSRGVRSLPLRARRSSLGTPIECELTL